MMVQVQREGLTTSTYTPTQQGLKQGYPRYLSTTPVETSSCFSTLVCRIKFDPATRLYVNGPESAANDSVGVLKNIGRTVWNPHAYVALKHRRTAATHKLAIMYHQFRIYCNNTNPMYFLTTISELRPVQKFSLDPYFQNQQASYGSLSFEFSYFSQARQSEGNDMGISSAYI